MLRPCVKLAVREIPALSSVVGNQSNEVAPVLRLVHHQPKALKFFHADGPAFAYIK